MLPQQAQPSRDLRTPHSTTRPNNKSTADLETKPRLHRQDRVAFREGGKASSFVHTCQGREVISVAPVATPWGKLLNHRCGRGFATLTFLQGQIQSCFSADHLGVFSKMKELDLALQRKCSFLFDLFVFIQFEKHKRESGRPNIGKPFPKP